MAIPEVPKKWDSEADVIIVGAGTAGLPAAITVSEEGFKATVLEARPACGGSLVMATGGFAIAGSDEQKEAGIDDSPELLYQDEVNIHGVEPEIARAFADNQLDAYKMLKQLGIKFPGVLLPVPRRGLSWTQGGGLRAAKALEGEVRARGIEILLRHRATKLITYPKTGRVIGMKVDVKGETKNFKAKRAVIIATGGFGRNREMVAEFAPEMVSAIPKMPVGHQGDGLKMALAIGAATKDIGIAVTPSWSVCADTHSSSLSAFRSGGIAVNAHGDRFYDESATAYHRDSVVFAGMRQPGGVFWVIYDRKIKEAASGMEKCKQYKADTFEELADTTGIDAERLKETVIRYNSDIDSAGYDTVFGRKMQFAPGQSLVKIDTPPFYAVKCTAATTSFKGGLKINGRSQVIDQFGEIIPGLYAAGEVAGGLHTRGYLLGSMSSGAMTFGIISGRNAVKESPWE